MKPSTLIRLFAAVLLAALLPFAAAADETDSKVAVTVSHSGDDAIGKQFAFTVREAIRLSAGFRLTAARDSGMQVHIVTVNPETAGDANWTVASITYTMTNFLPLDRKNPQTWYPIFLTSHVMTVGSRRLQDQARSVMAALDAQLERYRADLSRD